MWCGRPDGVRLGDRLGEPGRRPAADPQRRRDTNDNPAIDGPLVVWQSITPTQTLQSRIGATSWDILGYNLGNGNHLTVANSPADETNPAISGNVVVWQTYQNPPAAPQSAPLGVGRWSVAGVDVTGGAVFAVTDGPGDQVNPAISGSEIVYEDVPPASAAQAPGVLCTPPSNHASWAAADRSGCRMPTPSPAGRTPIGAAPSGSNAVAPSISTSGATSAPLSFSDVLPTDYFYSPVQALACDGAISGYTDSTFRAVHQHHARPTRQNRRARRELAARPE